MVREAHETYGDQIDRKDSNLRDKLSGNIETYMKGHPSYDPEEDPYLNRFNPSVRATGDISLFRDMRNRYWMNRCGCITVGNLEATYDYHDKVTTTKWSPKGVDWFSTSLDAVSTVLGFFGLNEVSQAAKISKPAKDTFIIGANITNGVSGFNSGLNGDTTGVALSGVGFIPGPPGVLASAVSTLRDLGKGFFDTPWIPSLPR